MSSYHLLPNLFSPTRPSQQSVKPKANFKGKLLETNRLPVHMYVSHKLAKTLGHEISLELAYIVKLLLILSLMTYNGKGTLWYFPINFKLHHLVNTEVFLVVACLSPNSYSLMLIFALRQMTTRNTSLLTG